ncbi:serine hydrolase domain-containing protein [Microvirga rosea]|uniref:serine hydrolase domain-containing protein n=1 Tax=Microvirga rosea TaxID=2715425 RepID=UPI001D0BE32F|nr:serine hydrolase domain-containing protein [Microvirga rosea]MCB8820810.1 beta-lactamase family protein [Microvirga rosea]
MAETSESQPSIAWAVVKAGRLEAGSDADLIVPWWSFTKTVLAAAALRLVQDGRLSLDQPLRGRAYSLRQLLQHRAGLPDYGGLQAYADAVARGDRSWPFEEVWDRCEADRLRYEPGEGWGYSNLGYGLVARLIEETTETNLVIALRELVFEPLRLDTPRLAVTRGDLREVQLGSATAYDPGWVYHGLVIGTVCDAALLLNRLRSGELLAPPFMAEMATAYELPGPIPDRPWLDPGYGLGVMIGSATSGLAVIGHTGGGPGSTVAVFQPTVGGPAASVFMACEDAGPTERKAFELIGA